MNEYVDSLLRDFDERVASDADLSQRNLQSLVLPSVRLKPERVPFALIDIGESRIGGVPDMPRDLEWPRWMPQESRLDRFGGKWTPAFPMPLGFIAQINLAEIASIDDSLPDSGWMYFFYDRYCEPWGYDPRDRGGFRVLYVDCDQTDLIRAESPEDLAPEHIASPCRIDSQIELTIPDEVPDIEYETPAYDAYEKLRQEVMGDGRGEHHRLLGNPQLVQNPMERECQLASNGVYCGRAVYDTGRVKQLEGGVNDWRLLLQIDSDEEGPGWMWGDVGRIYFWIKRQDLKSLRFDDVWVILQCS